MNKLIELKNAIKCDILFRTEDGVDIFEGDDFYFVTKTFLIERITANKLKNANKTFSTREAAKEYVNSRKPYLSNKDVLDEIEKCTNIQQLKKVFTNKVAY